MGNKGSNNFVQGMMKKNDQFSSFQLVIFANQLLNKQLQLETDPDILEEKARKALVKYGHQIVIGNILSTRKYVVHLITMNDKLEIKLSPEEIKAEVEIESKIIPELVKRHTEWIEYIKETDDHHPVITL